MMTSLGLCLAHLTTGRCWPSIFAMGLIRFNLVSVSLKCFTAVKLKNITDFIALRNVKMTSSRQKFIFTFSFLFV